MIIKIQIRTPAGQASKTQYKIEPIILGVILKRRIKLIEKYVNKEDDTFYWVINCSTYDALRLQKRVVNFTQVSYKILNLIKTNQLTKALRHKAIKKYFGFEMPTEDDITTLENAILNDTEVNIISEPTTKDLLQEHETWWNKIKNTFIKRS